MLAAQPAPLIAPRRARETTVGNLPHELTDFIGRERDITRLRELQVHTRLLSLVGPGGGGKSRLALQLGGALTDRFPDGTWWVDLSPITDPGLVPQAVADILGVRQQPGQAWLPELTRVLRSRRVLVVLDNCEHMLAACADLADGLLRACPELWLVCTSQQPLGVAGETIWRVSPLPLPPPGAGTSQELGASEAVQLFVARVRAQQPEFTLGEDTAPVVAEICRRLDGLPLALELVAARVESLGLAEVSRRLRDRFVLTQGIRRAAPARQRTLRGALDWSCSLLDDNERVLLRWLGVFVGGWTLEAAVAVCAGNDLAEGSVVDVLGQLVSKSLVVAEHGHLQVRYRLLETVRAYAHEQLAEVGDTAAIRDQHAAYLLRLAEQRQPESTNAAQALLLRPEEDNVRAALVWAMRNEQVELGLRLATAAFPLWWFTGHYREGATWLERLLALPTSTTLPGTTHALALTFHGQLLVMLGDFDLALASGEAALPEHQASGDARGTGLALMLLGNVAMLRGDLACARLRCMREVGSPGDTMVLAQLGTAAYELGEFDRARQYIAHLETIASSRPGPGVSTSALHLRALLASAEGSAATAASVLEQALQLRRPTGDQQGIAIGLTSLGHIRLDQGQRTEALEALGEAIALARAAGERVRLFRALEGYARALAMTHPDAAVRLAGTVDGQRRALGVVPWPSDRRHLEGWLSHTHRALGSSAYERAWEDGHASTLDQAVSLIEALALPAPTASAAGALSPRELEVVHLVAQGLTNRQIATRLVVSPATVRSHVEHILDKLSLHSRAQVAVWASQHGLLAGG